MTQAPFIVLDGIDGTGKSTQSRMLVEWLHERGIAAVRCCDPGTTPLGDKLRAILLDKKSELCLRAEAMLFMASRAELVEKIVRPSIENGIVVICDRFLLANVVYQGHAGGLDPLELWRIGHFSTNLLEPDIIYLFDMTVEQAEKRRGRAADRMEARDRLFQERVREGFLYEASLQPEKIQVLDASASVDAMQAYLRDRVLGLLRQRGFRLSNGTP
ncbi:MAG: dTMP kinase [Planctomycetes bacterium]|nr:dTMP kinase [Planctomycetota bacterium]